MQSTCGGWWVISNNLKDVNQERSARCCLKCKPHVLFQEWGEGWGSLLGFIFVCAVLQNSRHSILYSQNERVVVFSGFNRCYIKCGTSFGTVGLWLFRASQLTWWAYRGIPAACQCQCDLLRPAHYALFVNGGWCLTILLLVIGIPAALDSGGHNHSQDGHVSSLPPCVHEKWNNGTVLPLVMARVIKM